MASTSPNGGRPAPAHGPAAARRARAAAVLGWLALWQLAAWAEGRRDMQAPPQDAAPTELRRRSTVPKSGSEGHAALA